MKWSPSHNHKMTDLSDKFGSRWNFHNAIGGIDGKHITIKAPANSGSIYHTRAFS